MKKTISHLRLFLCCSLLLAMASISYAGSAEVLPKGIFRGEVEYGYYSSVDTKFDPDGHKERVDTDFNATLDSSVFDALGNLEVAFGLPAGSANLGDSVVDFEYDFKDLMLNFQYGLTDRLSIGVKIPYYWSKTDVNDVRVDTRNATVGINPFFGTPGDPFGVPIIPISFGGVKNDVLATESAQSQLEALGYKRLERWSGSGISDIEAGFKYQYLNTENWQLALIGAVRFPTGDVDDPDNLLDVGFGTGAYALLFRSNNDYTGLENFVFDFTLKYDLVLPERETLRILYNVNQPISANKEKVDRDIGDVFRCEVESTYKFLDAFSLSLLYEYAYKFEDRVSGDMGDMGFDYEAIEEETDWTYHRFECGLSYSTIPLFRAKKFPIPLDFNISYETFFDGTNNFLEQKIIWFRLACYF